MNLLSARPTLFGFLALLGLAACGGGEPTGSGAGGSAAAPVTQDVVAAKGGTVADAAKDVTLTIPAGALGTDTKVTLTVGPKEAGTATSVYTFSPAGVTFGTPATLTISTEGVTAPAKMKIVLGTQSDGSWVAVPGSMEGSGFVEAPVSGLAAFSAIFVDASGPCDASCMSQAGAVCCTACGCEAAVSCKPVCGSGTMWDCEIGCCYDYVAHMCVP